jgi:hypothetical protein
MGNTCNPQSQSGRGFNGLPAPFGGDSTLIPTLWRACCPGHLRASQTCYCSLSCSWTLPIPLRRYTDGRPSLSSDTRGGTRTSNTCNNAASTPDANTDYARAGDLFEDTNPRRQTRTSSAPPTPLAAPPGSVGDIERSRPAKGNDAKRRLGYPRPNTTRTEDSSRVSIRRLISRSESRSLSESTRQIASPTKNGHAPPSTES